MEFLQNLQGQQLAWKGCEVDFLDGQSLDAIDCDRISDSRSGGDGNVVGIRENIYEGSKKAGKDGLEFGKEGEKSKTRIRTGREAFGVNFTIYPNYAYLFTNDTFFVYILHYVKVN